MSDDIERHTRRQWTRLLTDPDAKLTLDEFRALPAAILLREGTPKQLLSALDLAVETGASMTLLEALVLAVAHVRQNTIDDREAGQHVEGMLTSFEAFFAQTIPGYRALADERARPVPVALSNGPARP